ncbi:hypothetical protein GCM10017566_66360 [Amycolatopsis bartoniae]|uniref:Uncharacterized protein n=1 Tax=Amycolatopsis bartoniae TaxID=941986 RepID=A0A8H9MFJ4_9PSEU|nr:hypothetical protein GCM10017566_66360 [Amycolatopsis bartoniae]
MRIGIPFSVRRRTAARFLAEEPLGQRDGDDEPSQRRAEQAQRIGERLAAGELPDLGGGLAGQVDDAEHAPDVGGAVARVLPEHAHSAAGKPP